METERPSVLAGLASLATGANAAVKAAEIIEEGGRPACEPAWSGETSNEERQKLRGSIVRLTSDKFAYLPLSSSAALLKSFGGRDAPRTVKIKVSLDGSESGVYHTPEEAERLIKSVWLGCCSLSGDRGEGAGGLTVGDVETAIRPLVAAAGEPFTKVIITVGGVDRTPIDIEEAASALGHEVPAWQPWQGCAAVAGRAMSHATTGSVESARGTFVLLAHGLEAAGTRALLQTAKVTVKEDDGTVLAGELAALAAAMAGEAGAADAIACCVAASAAGPGGTGDSAGGAAGARAAAREASTRVLGALSSILPQVTVDMLNDALNDEQQLRVVGAGGPGGVGMSLRRRLAQTPPPPQPVPCPR